MGSGLLASLRAGPAEGGEWQDAHRRATLILQWRERRLAGRTLTLLAPTS
jgi:hypothetical protein